MSKMIGSINSLKNILNNVFSEVSVVGRHQIRISKLCYLSMILVSLLIFRTSWAVGLSLDELISQGLASYPSVLAKQATRESAKTDLLGAKLKFLPNPSVSTQRQQVAYNGQPGSSQPATNMTISQPLFLDGGIIAGYNKADARLSAADFSLLETREEVSKRIINTYVEWLKAYLKIIALDESVRLHERFVGLITRRYEQGVASGSDKDLGTSRLYLAQAELDTQRSIEGSSLTSLSQLVGEPIQRSKLTDVIAKPQPLPKRVDGIFTAQMQSVSVQRYQFEAEAAEQEAKEIRAQALPQVAFQAQRQIGNVYLPGAPGYNMLGLVVSYTPGGGLSNITGSTAAFERADAARHQVEVAKRDLADRLNADYNEYEFSQLKKESLGKSVELSNDISASYDRQYLVGRKSWLDLMNAVREQAQTKVQLAEAEGSLLGSSRRLQIFINGTASFGAPNSK